ncbi:hypothetical protein JCM18694_09260 [Prolixibacter denitrificans]|uniref:Uncharacterized protein n=1 Tax=Prolixibacter denitrificans TaxID=1541063 RepID=A0ABQ0ZHC3_9BACT|nr:hypothetical protein JCM18694_09260 [Prolixibacter denitrificans]
MISENKKFWGFNMKLIFFEGSCAFIPFKDAKASKYIMNLALLFRLLYAVNVIGFALVFTERILNRSR